MAEILLDDVGRINTKEKLKQVMLTSVFHIVTIVAQQHGRISLLSTSPFTSPHKDQFFSGLRRTHACMHALCDLRDLSPEP